MNETPEERSETLAGGRQSADESFVPPAAVPPPPPPPPRRRRGGSGFFWGFLIGTTLLFLILGVVGAIAIFAMNGRPGPVVGTNRVAVVPIEGPIMESRETINTLKRFSEAGGVKALVVRINSPGGGVAPSQEIFQEIRRIRQESGKPIVASIDSVAASGGYYIAAACDTIVANPGSITGSIGVIAQWFNVERLLEWAKLQPQTITSGTMKDAGSPYRELTETEKVYFERLVNQLHGQFVRAVVDGRKGKMTEQEVVQIADGRVFTGEEAKQLKLVDELGNLEDAVRLAGRMAGMKGTPKTVFPRKREPGLLELLAESKTALERLTRAEASSPFLYRW